MLELLKAAVERRGRMDVCETDALRVVDGEGDGLPGLTIDRFGPAWLASAAASEGIDPPPALVAAMPEIEGIDALWWKRLDQRERDAPRCCWVRCEGAGSPELVVREHGMRLHVDLAAGYSQGVFLDQRLNRRRVLGASGGRSVLNLFSYTCAFSVAVGLGGGTATSLDLSQHYLDWGRRNMVANGLDPEQHYWCRGDSFEWLGRFARSGRQFGGLVIDPPTFSRSGKGRRRTTFRVEENLEELVRLAAEVLEPDGFLLATTNCRRLAEREFAAMVERGLGSRVELVGMPPEYRGERYLKSCWVERRGG